MERYPACELIVEEHGTVAKGCPVHGRTVHQWIDGAYECRLCQGGQEVQG